MISRQSKIKTNIVYIFALCILIAADQVTKILAERFLTAGEKVLISGVLEFKYLKNTGAAFSILENNVLFFVIVTFIVLILMIFIWIKIPAYSKYSALRVSLLFIFAGACGNLIDRITLHYVRDFIYISLINFPIFNVADIYVTVFAVVLVLIVLFKYKDGDFAFLRLSNKSDT